jgi:hypothetical protein
MLKTGEKLYTLAEKILDPAMISLFQMMSDQFERSTIYRTATGGMIGPGTAYSTVALTSQQGRLPTVVYQRMISMALGEAMRLAFVIAKRDKSAVKATSENGLKKIEPASIPDYFDLVATLEVDQASDDRVNSQVAAEGVKSGLWSKRYGREKYIKIGQSDAMEKEIWDERYVDMKFQLAFTKKQQEETAKMQAQIQQMMQQQQGQMQQGQPGQMPQGMPGQMPPGMPPDAQGAQPGLPMGAPAEPMGSQMGPGGMPPEMGGPQ